MSVDYENEGGDDVEMSDSSLCCGCECVRDGTRTDLFGSGLCLVLALRAEVRATQPFLPTNTRKAFTNH